MANSEKLSDTRAGKIIESAENFDANNSLNQEKMINELNTSATVAALYGSTHSLWNEFLD
jgi:hypothetical protein